MYGAHEGKKKEKVIHQYQDSTMWTRGHPIHGEVFVPFKWETNARAMRILEVLLATITRLFNYIRVFMWQQEDVSSDINRGTESSSGKPSISVLSQQPVTFGPLTLWTATLPPAGLATQSRVSGSRARMPVTQRHDLMLATNRGSVWRALFVDWWIMRWLCPDMQDQTWNPNFKKIGSDSNKP